MEIAYQVCYIDNVWGVFSVEFCVDCPLIAILEFFGSSEEARVYYGGDLIFGLSVDFDRQARRLYMARMKIINGDGFKKVDMKNRVYIKITKEA